MSDRQGKGSSNEVVTFATLTGLLAFIPISTDLYLPAIPMMTEALGTSVSSSQLTLSLFMLGVAFGQVIFGPLSDHYGRLPVARAGCILFVGFSLVSALAWSIEYMWLARICQGATAASGAVIARAMIRDRYIGDRAAQMMALTSASMASVPLLAPTLGAYITVELGWRFTFAAQALFGAAVLIGLATFEEVTHETSDDLESKLTFRSIVNTFRVCLQNPLFIGYQMAGTLSFCALFVYLSTVSFFLPDVFGVPTEYFGLAFAMTVTGFIVGSLASARLVMTLGAKPDPSKRRTCLHRIQYDRSFIIVRVVVSHGVLVGINISVCPTLHCLFLWHRPGIGKCVHGGGLSVPGTRWSCVSSLRLCSLYKCCQCRCNCGIDLRWTLARAVITHVSVLMWRLCRECSHRQVSKK